MDSLYLCYHLSSCLSSQFLQGYTKKAFYMNEHQNRKKINYSPVVCENLSPLQVVFDKQ